MIHYSVVPPEELWSEWLGEVEPASNDAAADPSETAVCRLAGVPVLVERVGSGRRVLRLLSTDPAHYLDPALTPGRRIEAAGSGDHPASG